MQNIRGSAPPRILRNMSNILAICIVLYNLCTVNNDVIKHEWIIEKKKKKNTWKRIIDMEV